MIVSIRRILLPTDFSAPAREAKVYALEMAARFGAELHLLHVLPIVMPFPDDPSSWTTPDVEQQQQTKEAERRLGIEIDPASVSKSPVTCVRVGFAVDEIVKYVKEKEIDLIVLGTHGHTGLSLFLIGSVAEKLVRIAPCPVLTVHPKDHEFLLKSGAKAAQST